MLLAEDGRVNQIVATRMLEGRGHSVVVAEDGQVALDTHEKERFDAIMEAIMAAKPSSIKGVYLRRVTMASTMGPGITVKIIDRSIGCRTVIHCRRKGLDMVVVFAHEPGVFF